MRRLPIALLLSTTLLLVAGCKTIEVLSQVGTTIGTATGALSSDQADSINRSSAAVGKTLDKLTPENEYYVGRTVVASLLGTYKPYDNAALNLYLNLVGQSLAAVSDKPETFAGYRFLAMDTDEINAFAAPGGFILVSRGLLRCCRTEDELAAVLAHEVGHVQHEHALQAISKSRMTTALTVLAVEAGRNLAGNEVAELTSAFEGSIGDIFGTMVNSGYSRKFEGEADAAAITIMKRLGYNPIGLRSMLAEMERRVEPEKGFGKTHPAPANRIKAIAGDLKGAVPLAPPASRQARFEQAMKGV